MVSPENLIIGATYSYHGIHLIYRGHDALPTYIFQAESGYPLYLDATILGKMNLVVDQ